MAKKTVHEQIAAYYREFYVPALSFALMISQQPDAALRAVQEVFIQLARSNDTSSDLQTVFTRIAIETPNMNIREGYNPTNAISRSGRTPYYGYQTFGALFESHTEPTRLSMITDPIQAVLDDGDTIEPMLRMQLSLLLQWLRNDLGDVHLATFLSYWLQYNNMENTYPSFDKIIGAVSKTIGQDKEYTADLIERGNSMWQLLSEQIGSTFAMNDIMSAWIEVYHFPPVDMQIAEMVATEQKFRNHPAVRNVKQVITTVLLVALVVGWLRPGLGILPWQWRFFVQIPIVLEQNVGEFACNGVVIPQPWKLQYSFGDNNGRSIGMIHEKGAIEAWNSPLNAEDELLTYAQLHGEVYPVYLTYLTTEVYMRFVEGDSTIIISGEVGEENIESFAYDVMSILRRRME